MGRSVKIIESRAVDDPMMTDAEFIYRRRQESERAEAAGRRPNPYVGKVMAQVDMVSLIGGFARFKDRSEPQIMAAARFRKIYEAMQVGDTKAVDLSAIRVDTSGPRGDIEFIKGEDARRAYRDAIQTLGMQTGSLVENVVVYDKSVRLIARAYGYGENKAGRIRIRNDLFRGLDILAHHFGYISKKPLD